MKKTLLLVTVLFISVISTACINNFAVQELNNKAKEFMDKGDYTSAIERLKSSVDLDGNVFETRYNLAVAYTNAEDYPNAIKTYNEAVKLNPDFADLYYSLAVCEENLAKDIISGEIVVNEDETIEKAPDKKDNEKDDTAEKKDDKLSEVSVKVLTSMINNSISDYQLYLDKSNNNDKDEIDNKIKELQELLVKHAK